MRDANLQRLLWKEIREGWPVIAAFLVLPVLVFLPCAFFPSSNIAAAMIATVMISVPFTAVLWASEKSRTTKQGRDLLGAILPVTSVQDWVASFLLPSLAVGVCGGWMMFMLTVTAVGRDSQYRILNGGIIFATGFMLSSFLSKSVSRLLAIIFGTLWIFWAFFNSINTFTFELAFVPIVLASAALLVSEFRKSGSKFLKVFAVTTLVILFCVVFQKEIVMTLFDIMGNQRRTAYEYNGFWTKDGSLVRRDRGDAKIDGDGDYITYEDSIQGVVSSAGHVTRKRFPSSSLPIAVDHTMGVYVISQPNENSDISLLRWDINSDHVDTVCKISPKCGIDIHSLGRLRRGQMDIPGCIDPDATRLILNIPSVMGTGQDLWMINLSSGACRLLAVNERFAWDKVTWVKDRAYLTGSLTAVEVNTKDFTVKPLIQERKSGQ